MVLGANVVTVSAGWPANVGALTATVSPLAGTGVNAGSVKVPLAPATAVTVAPLGKVAVTTWPGVAPEPVTTPSGEMVAVMPVVLGANVLAISAGWPAEVGALTETVSPLAGTGANAGKVKVPSGRATAVTDKPLGKLAVTVWPGVAPEPVTTPSDEMLAVMPVVFGATVVPVSAG